MGRLADCDLLVEAGDYNARTKQIPDFIPEIDGDLVPQRFNPDTGKNSHGVAFLDFLKGIRALILNGRITPQFNDYTFVTARGCSVPDYIFCSAEHIQYCKQMKTFLMRDICKLSGIPPPKTLPDHSILQGIFKANDISQKIEHLPVKVLPNKTLKRKIDKIDFETFFLGPEILEEVSKTTNKLEC